MKKLLLTGTIVLLTAVSASAGPEAEHRGHWVSPGQWQMNDIGRNHGEVSIVFRAELTAGDERAARLSSNREPSPR